MPCSTQSDCFATCVSAQLRLVEIADAPDCLPTEDAATPALDVFLEGLRTSWKTFEVRPTARSKPKAKRGRRRPDPLVEVTEKLRAWFEAEPWRTARELLEKLQTEQPGDYPEKLLRTLQRRPKSGAPIARTKWSSVLRAQCVRNRGRRMNAIAYGVGGFASRSRGLRYAAHPISRPSLPESAAAM